MYSAICFLLEMCLPWVPAMLLISLILDPVIYYIPAAGISVPPVWFFGGCFFFTVFWVTGQFANPYFQPLFWQIFYYLVPVLVIGFLFFLQYHFQAALMLILFFIVLKTGIFLWTRRSFAPFPLSGKKLRQYRFTFRRLSLLAFCLTFLGPSVLVMTVYGLKSPSLQAQTRPSNSETNAFEQLVNENMDTLKQLEPQTWPQLSPQQRLDLSQTLANIETSYLGIPSLSVVSSKLEDSILGRYRNETILIDLSYLQEASPAELVDVVCHECRHAYQESVVNMLDWSDETVQTHAFYREARQWKEDFAYYVSGDTPAYYEQSVEQDARKYAAQAVLAYDRYIDLLSAGQ